MVKQKLEFNAMGFYETPKCETFNISVGSVLCTSDSMEKLNPIEGGQGGLG